MDQPTKNLTNSDVVPIIPVNARSKVLPSIISRVVLGGTVNKWHGREDVIVIEDVYGKMTLHIDDFKIAKEVAEQIIKELGLQRMVQPHQVLVIRDRAQDILESMIDERAGMRGIIMLRDPGGCGYWRVTLPSKNMDMTDIYVDVTGGTVGFDYLMKYETIFVQRMHNWDSFSVMERLKKGGKRLIYDIDDDIFSIPTSNPSYNAFGRNEQMAAVECMKLADVVVVSTTSLKQRIEEIIPGCNTVMIPNAIDPDDGWVPLKSIGSPDGWKRIFWQGSSTHNEDWNECFEAVQQVMLDRDDVRLVLMGFLPTRVCEIAEEPQCKNRIEYMGPLEPEAYFRLIKHIRGEVGLAPLCNNLFNQSKSCIKWMENSLIGMPTAASDVRPYSEVIQSGKNGFLCNTTEDWVAAIERCLDDSVLRKGIVENARNKIKTDFNIKEIAKVWKNLLLGK